MGQARSQLRPTLVIGGLLLLITSVIYPLVVTGVAQVAFPGQANGSLVAVGDRVVGSSLIGQAFSSPKYFHGRPSAAGDGYDASASSGSNLGPTSDKLINGIHDPKDPSGDFDGIVDRARAFREENGLAADAPLPADAVTASGSGLDPHVSPATALLQVVRVAKARGADEAKVRALVEQSIERAELGVIGQDRVNVLKLNVALDAQFPAK